MQYCRSPSQLSVVCSSSVDNTQYYLSLVHILCYSSNMIVSELLYPRYCDILTFSIIKYVLGYSFTYLFPVIVILNKRELRLEMMRVLRESSSRPDMSQDEKLQEIGKEMLNIGT